MDDMIVDEFDLDVRLTATPRPRAARRFVTPLQFRDDEAGAEGEWGGDAQEWGDDAGQYGDGDSSTCYSTCADPECGGEQAGTNGQCPDKPPPTRTRAPCDTDPYCPDPNQDDSSTCYSTCAGDECDQSNTCYSTCSDQECDQDQSSTCFSTCSDCPTVHNDTCVGACTSECE